MELKRHTESERGVSRTRTVHGERSVTEGWETRTADNQRRRRYRAYDAVEPRNRPTAAARLAAVPCRHYTRTASLDWIQPESSASGVDVLFRGPGLGRIELPRPFVATSDKAIRSGTTPGTYWPAQRYTQSILHSVWQARDGTGRAWHGHGSDTGKNTRRPIAEVARLHIRARSADRSFDVAGLQQFPAPSCLTHVRRRPLLKAHVQSAWKIANWDCAA